MPKANIWPRWNHELPTWLLRLDETYTSLTTIFVIEWITNSPCIAYGKSIVTAGIAFPVIWVGFRHLDGKWVSFTWDCMKIAFLRHDMQSYHALLRSCSTHLCNRCSFIRFRFTLRNGVNLILPTIFPDKSHNEVDSSDFTLGYNLGYSIGYRDGLSAGGQSFGSIY